MKFAMAATASVWCLAPCGAWAGEPWGALYSRGVIVAAIASPQAMATWPYGELFSREATLPPEAPRPAAPSKAPAQADRPLDPSPPVRLSRVPRGPETTAVASWYGGGEKLQRLTANGEVFRPEDLTAAHRSLPFGTKLEVSANGKTVVVRINDRGPAKHTGRSLDLSRGAARALGMIHRGTARVTWRVAGI